MVEYIVAIDVTRVRFPADAFCQKVHLRSFPTHAVKHAQLNQTALLAWTLWAALEASKRHFERGGMFWAAKGRYVLDGFWVS